MVIWMQKGGVTKQVEDYNIAKFEKLGFKKIVEKVEFEVEEVEEVKEVKTKKK